jgi:hypothetical protein
VREVSFWRLTRVITLDWHPDNARSLVFGFTITYLRQAQAAQPHRAQRGRGLRQRLTAFRLSLRGNPMLNYERCIYSEA